MAKQLGLSSKLYRNTGSWASPTWSETDSVKTSSINFEIAMADVSDRGSTWREYLSGLKDATVELEFVYDPADADQAALITAALAGTATELAMMDTDITTSGTDGFRGVYEFSGLTKNEPLEEGVTVNMTAKPSSDNGGNEPQAYTVP